MTKIKVFRQYKKSIIVRKSSYLYLKERIKSIKGLRKKITIEINTVLKKCSWSRVLSTEYSMAIVQHPCVLAYGFSWSIISGCRMNLNSIRQLLHTFCILFASYFFFRTASGILFLFENRRIQETQICKRVPSSQFPTKVKRDF